jgi:hypothetical protein
MDTHWIEVRTECLDYMTSVRLQKMLENTSGANNQKITFDAWLLRGKL